eukprot:7206132-Heterocapsa_arctica.AAC.1
MDMKGPHAATAWAQCDCPVTSLVEMALSCIHVAAEATDCLEPRRRLRFAMASEMLLASS